MVVVPTHAAEVNCIVGNSCLILPKAKLFCDYGVLFWVGFFPSPLPLFVHVDGIHASFPQFPTVCRFPWGFILGLREFLQFSASLGLLTRCSLCGRPLQWPQGSQHTLFHAGHSGQAADSNDFWLGLHRHM